MKNYSEALLAAEKALEFNPKFAVAYVSKGNALAGEGKYEESIEAFDKAIELDSNCVEAYVSKAFSLEKLEKYDELIELCQKAKNISSKDPDYYAGIYLNWSAGYLGKSDYSEAVKCL